MYIVIHEFKDREDKNKYKVGDEYPINTKEVSEERIVKLSTSDNAIGVPLIKKIDIPEEKHELISNEDENLKDISLDKVVIESETVNQVEKESEEDNEITQEVTSDVEEKKENKKANSKKNNE